MRYVFYTKHQEMRQFWPLSKEFATHAIELSKKWSQEEIPDTPDDFQQYLIGRLESTFERVHLADEAHQRHLAFFRGLIKNPASAIFLDLMRGTESTFFIQWLQNAMAVNAFAMEPAYRRGIDIHGRFMEMPEFDPAVAMADDIGYVYTRWRDNLTAKLMQHAGKEATIVSIAHGTMPELRYFDYPESLLLKQHFVCYDVAAIGLKALLQEAGLEVPHLHQEQKDLEAAIYTENLLMPKRRVDLVNIKGFLSYALTALPQIIPAIVKLLPSGGKFAFDLQLAHWTMRRNQWIFLWGQSEGIHFDLLRNAAEAAQLVYRIIALNDLPVTVDVKVPADHDEIVGVYIILTRK